MNNYPTPPIPQEYYQQKQKRIMAIKLKDQKSLTLESENIPHACGVSKTRRRLIRSATKDFPGKSKRMNTNSR